MLDQYTQNLTRLLRLHIEASKSLICASKATIKSLNVLIDLLDPPPKPPSNSHPVDVFLASIVLLNDGRFPHVRGAIMYRRYRTWAKAKDTQVLSARAFHREMNQRGHERHKKSGIEVYKSLALPIEGPS